jgi:hypothetical protein
MGRVLFRRLRLKEPWLADWAEEAKPWSIQSVKTAVFIDSTRPHTAVQEQDVGGGLGSWSSGRSRQVVAAVYCVSLRSGLPLAAQVNRPRVDFHLSMVVRGASIRCLRRSATVGPRYLDDISMKPRIARPLPPGTAILSTRIRPKIGLTSCHRSAACP